MLLTMSNKDIVSFEGVVKSDSSIEQRVYFVRELHRPHDSVLCSRGGLLRINRRSPTVANLGPSFQIDSTIYLFYETNLLSFHSELDL